MEQCFYYSDILEKAFAGPIARSIPEADSTLPGPGRTFRSTGLWLTPAASHLCFRGLFEKLYEK